MNAAVEAGLGGGNGMYGHIGALNKELNSSRNTGRRPRDGPRGGSIHAAASSSGRHSGKGSMITTKQTRVAVQLYIRYQQKQRTLLAKN